MIKNSAGVSDHHEEEPRAEREGGTEAGLGAGSLSDLLLSVYRMFLLVFTNEPGTVHWSLVCRQ